MNGIVILVVVAVMAILVGQRFFGRVGRVRDTSGRVVPTAEAARVGVALAVPVLGLVMLATTVWHHLDPRRVVSIHQALARSPNHIQYLYVDKLSDKISVILSDQNTIMDLKGILEGRNK